MNVGTVCYKSILIPGNQDGENLFCHDCLEEIPNEEQKNASLCKSRSHESKGKYTHHLHHECFLKLYVKARETFLINKGLKQNDYTAEAFFKSKIFVCPTCKSPIEDLNYSELIDLSKRPDCIDRSNPSIAIKVKHYLYKGLTSGMRWGGLTGVIWSIFARNLLNKIRLPIVIDYGSFLGIISAPIFGALGGMIGEVTSGLTIDLMNKHRIAFKIKSLKSRPLRIAFRVGLTAFLIIHTVAITMISVYTYNRISISTPLPVIFRVASILSLAVGILKTSSTRFYRNFNA
jgi:hypothetical protein